METKRNYFQIVCRVEGFWLVAYYEDAEGHPPIEIARVRKNLLASDHESIKRFVDLLTTNMGSAIDEKLPEAQITQRQGTVKGAELGATKKAEQRVMQIIFEVEDLLKPVYESDKVSVVLLTRGEDHCSLLTNQLGRDAVIHMLRSAEENLLKSEDIISTPRH